MHSKNFLEGYDLESIQFVNNKNDVKFGFVRHVGNFDDITELRGHLVCCSVKSLEIFTNMDDYPYFPQTVCDLVTESLDWNKKRIKFHGCDYDITVVCESIEVVKDLE